jgi:hypothetical protein
LLISIDGSAVVVPLVGIVVTQVTAAELQEMISFQPSKVVTEHAVVAIPVARANVLVVGIVRGKQGRAVARAAVFAADFQSCRVSGNVRHTAGTGISPPVTRKAEMEIICEIWPDVLG